MAGHRIADNAILGLSLGTQADQPRATVGQRPSRLAFDRRVDTPTADPADGAPVGEQERAIARFGRSRPHAAHDGRQHVRLTLASQLSGALQQIAGRGSVHKATPLSWRMRHSRGGVMGISTCVTPRWESASTTALTMAGGAPTVADSPTPLAPKGWWGLGVTVRPVSHFGVSIDVGTR